jgi:hypothetical protein
MAIRHVSLMTRKNGKQVRKFFIIGSFLHLTVLNMCVLNVYSYMSTFDNVHLYIFNCLIKARGGQSMLEIVNVFV